MYFLSYRAELVEKTKEVISYDDASIDVIRAAKKHGYDLKTDRIVRFQGDPDYKNYQMPEERDLTLRSSRPNIPGPLLGADVGFGTIAKSPELIGHGELKSTVIAILERFSIPYYVSVTTGMIMLDFSQTCLEQITAFRKFCLIYCSYNWLFQYAGYNFGYILQSYGEYCPRTGGHWPVTALPNERSPMTVDCRIAKDVYDNVAEDVKLLYQRNSRDPYRMGMYRCQIYRDTRRQLQLDNDLDPEILKATFRRVHQLRPAITSYDRPRETPYLDGVICAYEHCNTTNCVNTIHCFTTLEHAIIRYKATEECQAIDKEKWGHLHYSSRPTQSE